MLRPNLGGPRAVNEGVADPDPVLAGLLDLDDLLPDQRALQEMAYELHEAREFTVTGEHLALLHNFHVQWRHLEFGAPSISPNRPYGNSDVLGDIAAIVDPAGLAAAAESTDAYLAANEARFLRLHAETMLALQISLTTGQFAPGRYVRPRYHWVSAADPEAGAVCHFQAVHAASGQYMCYTVHGTVGRDAVTARLALEDGWEVSEPATPALPPVSAAAARLRDEVLAAGWDVLYAGTLAGGTRGESLFLDNPDAGIRLTVDFEGGKAGRALDDLQEKVRSRPRPHCAPDPAALGFRAGQGNPVPPAGRRRAPGRSAIPGAGQQHRARKPLPGTGERAGEHRPEPERQRRDAVDR